MSEQRNSSLELLRILCIVGIIIMHSFGVFYGTCSGFSLVYGTVINTIFNACVSIFMLITGYFGARCSLSRIVKLEMMILFYGIIGEAVAFFVFSEQSLRDVFRAFFPVITRKYWYMSAYMVILALAKYIDLFLSYLSKKQMQRMLLILLCFFYMIPSFVYFQTFEEGGKGIVTMFIVYLVGRYIRLNCNADIKTRKLIAILLIAVCGGFVGNLFMSLSTGGGVGLNCPWANDNSIIILVMAVCIFLLFKRMNFYVRSINVVASTVFATYLFEGTIRKIIGLFFDLSFYENSYLLPLICLGVAIVVMAVCFCIELIRCNTLARLDKYVCSILLKLISVVQGITARRNESEDCPSGDH